MKINKLEMDIMDKKILLNNVKKRRIECETKIDTLIEKVDKMGVDTYFLLRDEINNKNLELSHLDKEVREINNCFGFLG